MAAAGRLVMVVGPSGAGKDSLIRGAREALAGDPRYVFPQRFVTRAPSPSENNLELTMTRFEALRQADAFCVSWTAHGLGYGLPRTIDDEIAAGRDVICNVSRTVVSALRGRYGHTVFVEVTAPRDVLAARLAQRGRPDDGAVDQRLGRNEAFGDLGADVTIVNADDFAVALERFVQAIR